MILTREQEMIREMARDFAQRRLAPNAAQWEREAAFPREALKEMGGLGLLGVTVPAEWDGAGADDVAYALALEEIAAGDPATSTVMSGHNSVGCSPILQYGTDEQMERWLKPLARGELFSCFCLTEPGGGSDAGALKTRATRDGDAYVLNGRKQYITSGANADLALIFATLDPAQGRRAITAFVVDTKSPGYRVERKEPKMGQNASDTVELAFEELRVPASARLGQEGEGYRIALANLEGGRIGIASTAVGMARAAYELALAYAQERQSFGQPIYAHQAVSFRLAEMATGIEAARQMVLHAAALKGAGRPCRKEAAMAKLFATDMAERVCSDAIQTFGGAGYMVESQVERIFRAARGTRIYEGSNDIQRLVISRALIAE
jgi:alkylation response protein AidB-like acyl-CoA dehydrogenase